MENDALKPWRELPAHLLPKLLQAWYKDCLPSTQCQLIALVADGWPDKIEKWYEDSQFPSLPTSEHLSVIRHLEAEHAGLYESLRFFVFGHKSETPATVIVPSWRELPIEEIPERIRMWFYTQNPAARAELKYIAQKTNVRWPSATEPLLSAGECLDFIKALRDHNQKFYDSVVKHIQQAPPSEQKDQFNADGGLPPEWESLPVMTLPERTRDWYFSQSPANRNRIVVISKEMQVKLPLSVGPLLTPHELSEFVKSLRHTNQTLYESLVTYVQQAPPSEKKETTTCYADMLPSGWRVIPDEQLSQTMNNWYWRHAITQRRQIQAQMRFLDSRLDFGDINHPTTTLPREQIAKFVCILRQNDTTLYTDLTEFVCKATQANLLPAVEQKEPDINEKLPAPAEPQKPATALSTFQEWQATQADLPKSWQAIAPRRLAEWFDAWYWTQTPTARNQLWTICITEGSLPKITDTDYYGTSLMPISQIVSAINQKSTELYKALLDFVQHKIDTSPPTAETAKTPEPEKEQPADKLRELSGNITDDAWALLLRSWYWACTVKERTQLETIMSRLQLPWVANVEYYRQHAEQREQFIAAVRQTTPELYAKFMQYVQRMRAVCPNPERMTGSDIFNEQDDLPEAWLDLDIGVLTTRLNDWHFGNTPEIQRRVQEALRHVPLLHRFGEQGKPDETLTRKALAEIIDQLQCHDLQLYELFYTYVAYASQYKVEAGEPTPVPATTTTTIPVTRDLPPSWRGLTVPELVLALETWYWACKLTMRGRINQVTRALNLPIVTNTKYYQANSIHIREIVSAIKLQRPELYAALLEYAETPRTQLADKSEPPALTIEAAEEVNAAYAACYPSLRPAAPAESAPVPATPAAPTYAEQYAAEIDKQEMAKPVDLTPGPNVRNAEDGGLPADWWDIRTEPLAQLIQDWYLSGGEHWEDVQANVRKVLGTTWVRVITAPSSLLTRREIQTIVARLRDEARPLYDNLWQYVARRVAGEQEILAKLGAAKPQEPAVTVRATTDMTETETTTVPEAAIFSSDGLPLAWQTLPTAKLSELFSEWGWSLSDDVRSGLPCDLHIGSAEQPNCDKPRGKLGELVQIIRDASPPLYEQLFAYVASQWATPTKTAAALPQKWQGHPSAILSYGVSRWYFGQPTITRMRIREILHDHNTRISPGSETWPNRHMPVTQIADIAKAVQAGDAELYASLVAQVATNPVSTPGPAVMRSIAPSRRKDGPLPLWWETLPRAIQETALLQAGIVSVDIVPPTEQFLALRKQDNMPAELDLLELICKTLYTLHNQKLINWATQVKPPVPIAPPKKKKQLVKGLRPNWLLQPGMPETLDIDAVVLVLQAWINKHCCGAIKKFNEVGHDTPVTLDDLCWRGGHSADTARKLVENMIAPEPAAVVTAKRLLAELAKWKLPATLPEPLPPHLTICAQLQRQLKKIEQLEATATEDDEEEGPSDE